MKYIICVLLGISFAVTFHHFIVRPSELNQSDAAQMWASGYTFSHPNEMASMWHRGYIQWLVENKTVEPCCGVESIRQFWDSVNAKYLIKIK